MYVMALYHQVQASGGTEAEAKAACEAVGALCEMGSIDTMISSFLRPLQHLPGPDDRVHCSLNLNTETGRLSSRKPNLQNQPALEKDRYKIRKAFKAEPGKTLIVADYGQLELRLLAHIAGCHSMLQAFALGGDFHSRTAIGMYPHVAEAVAAETVLLEWNPADGAVPKPLLKDHFTSERRKAKVLNFSSRHCLCCYPLKIINVRCIAKVLNFSIAYGKTAHGLAKDWDVSRAEAAATLEAWYADRPEVRQWQKRTIEKARETVSLSQMYTGFTCELLIL